MGRKSVGSMVLDAIKKAGDIGITAEQLAETIGAKDVTVRHHCKRFVDDPTSGVISESGPTIYGKGRAFYYSFVGERSVPKEEPVEEKKMFADNPVKDQVDDQMTKYKNQICKILDIDPSTMSWMGLYSYIEELATTAMVQKDELQEMSDLKDNLESARRYNKTLVEKNENLAKRLAAAELQIEETKKISSDNDLKLEIEMLQRDVKQLEQERDIYRYCFDRITEVPSFVD